MSFLEFLAKNGINISQENDVKNDNIWRIQLDAVVKTCQLLKTSRIFNYDMLLCISCNDLNNFFEIIYHFYSTSNNKKLILKTIIPKEKPQISSITDIYSSADWHERECFDLFGVIFENHPRLERLLLPIDFEGHPMLKNYVQNDERLRWNKR